MGRAMVDVSAHLILDALAFPEGTIIMGIKYIPESYTLRLYVSHEDLPELPEAAIATPVTPLHTYIEGRRPADWIAFDWNLPEGK